MTLQEVSYFFDHSTQVDLGNHQIIPLSEFGLAPPSSLLSHSLRGSQIRCCQLRNTTASRFFFFEPMESLSASSTSNDWRDSRSAPAAAQAFNPSMQQLSEHHYNYVEPSPSTFASPTDSSPSSSPQAFERRRHSANNASLFLAQHTSAVPISIDPLDATGPVWPSHSSELRYSPPLRYSLVPQSMEYAVASPLSSYPYPPAAGPNAFGHYGDATTMGSLNRRRLTAHPFHHPQPPHFYESGGAGYWTMVQEQEQEPYHHQVGDYHGSRLQVWAQEQQHQHHHQQQDQSGYSQMMDSRPQLLLATSMPTSAPIVIGTFPFFRLV